MSTDYYTYTGTTPEGLEVNVITSGWNERCEEPRIEDIYKINGVYIRDVDPLIRKMVLGGDISLTYTGGWCSSGGIWDAEGNNLADIMIEEEYQSSRPRDDPLA